MKSSLKLYKNAIILVVVVALLAGVYGVVSYIKSKEQTERKTYDKLIDLSSLDMQELTIERENEKLVFVRDENDNEWKLKYPENIKYNPSKLSSAAINFSSVFADKLIEENATDLSIYGLDKPVTVTAKMKDGRVESLEIGNLTPTGGAYYVKKKGENTVYITDTFTIDKVRLTINDIRETTLFNVTNEDFKELAMTRKGQLVFRAKYEDENEKWVLTEPIRGNANISAIYPMLDAIIQTQIDKFVEQDPQDLNKYGLDKPSYELEFETVDGKTRMLLGKEDTENSLIYMMIDGISEVYTISSKPFTFLDKPIEEIVESFAYIVNIWDVERIEVEMDGYKLDLKLETDPDKDTDKDKFYVNGKDASMKDENGKQPFRAYYQALIGVTLDKVEPDAQPVGEAEITFTYYLKIEPKVMKVEFIPKDDRYYYVVRNGEYSGLVVDKRKFDQPEGVRESYKKLMAALNSASSAENSSSSE
ncbi:MAG TPA: DUF4340 domain-containing protein [Clostridiaceae bacterium]|nr:DUF4340 domain-containing protein [Clostridiaceae bacterium]